MTPCHGHIRRNGPNPYCGSSKDICRVINGYQCYHGKKSSSLENNERGKDKQQLERDTYNPFRGP